MDWERVKQAFHEVLHAPDREHALQSLAEDVRAEVLELLRAHDAVPREPLREGPGTSIGRYKLLQQIGEGGFGVVWMAEQTEPVRRKVALKILRAGMDTGQVVARFEAERQALAVMDHPGIAKVLDAGEFGGRPYFAMELVKGVPITQFCDDGKLDTRQRLELFARVCLAVQHAHQKGIIHRDLKPSNVLVALHDGEPAPKVIDFGIAKALDQRLTERTLFTEFRQMIGTPEYMAPEQAEMSGLDVDTRADIYSLGVMLYELLTGTKPFDLREAVQRGFEELLRTIREVDPPRPSTRVSTLGDDLGAVAARRRAAPHRLGKILRGDLDWIVMKALEKDRARRYETANALALDVRRALDHQPVEAAPPTPLYRARKYVRRHRLAVGAASASALALLAGSLLSLQGYVEASTQRSIARSSHEAAAREAADAEAARAGEARERALAETEEAAARTEAAKAAAVVDLLKDLLGAADPEEVKAKGYTVRQLLDDFDRGLGERLAGQPEVEASVRLTMGKAYLGLGLPERAAPHVEAALATRRGAGEQGFADALAARARLEHHRARYRECAATAREVVAIRRAAVDEAALAEALEDLADALTHLGRLDDAEGAAREALAIRRAQPRADVAASLDTLASVLREKRDLDGAAAALDEAIRIGRERPGIGLAVCLGHMAAVRCGRLDFKEAESLLEEARSILSGSVPDDHPAVLYNRIDLASALLATGRAAQAESCLGEVLAAADRAFGEAHPGKAMALLVLGQARMGSGDVPGAEARFREALAILSASGERPEAAMVLGALGQTCLARGDAAGAKARLRESIELLGRTLGEEHPQVAEATAMLGQTLFVTGDREGAKALVLDAVKRHRTHQLLAMAGWFLVQDGRHEEAEPLLRDCLAIREREMPGDWSRYSAMSVLGASLMGQGKFAEAEPLLVEGYERMDPPPMPLATARKREALDRIVKLYEAWGKPEKAAEWRKRGGGGDPK